MWDVNSGGVSDNVETEVINEIFIANALFCCEPKTKKQSQLKCLLGIKCHINSTLKTIFFVSVISSSVLNLEDEKYPSY